MIGTIMAIASGAASIGQQIASFQKAKQAEKQAMILGNQMNAMKIKDAYAALQAPDIATAQYNETMRQATQATQALQGMGPEGAAQIANLNQSILQQNAQTAADQAALNYQRDMAVAEGRNQNAQYEYANQMQNIQNRIEGAQGAATAGREAGMSAIAGGIEGIGSGLAYDYGNADKVWPTTKEGVTTGTGLDGQTGGNSNKNKIPVTDSEENPAGDILKMKGKDRRRVQTTTTAPLTGMYSAFQIPQNIG